MATRRKAAKRKIAKRKTARPARRTKKRSTRSSAMKRKARGLSISTELPAGKTLRQARQLARRKLGRSAAGMPHFEYSHKTGVATFWSE